MEKFRVYGPFSLNGTVDISGAKNAALLFYLPLFWLKKQLR
ncbi:Uncharacterised protein [Mannheimia haemolytica]|uniref:Uncharacterized protein n=1 Tax=Mannheimia haemolytica TaxID=75985 RepID=A0A378MYL2_MANHA|nr:Uncharacterised protein [Mannheimia haemolytica]